MPPPSKPVKPSGSPLNPAGNGQWQKKVQGRKVYFGPWDDHAGALRRYHQYEAARQRGEDPDLLKAQGYNEHPDDAPAPAPWTWW